MHLKLSVQSETRYFVENWYKNCFTIIVTDFMLQLYISNDEVKRFVTFIQVQMKA